MSDTYECASCHEVNEKGWTDEEAMKEHDDMFGKQEPDDMAIICDDCYKIIMGPTEAAARDTTYEDAVALWGLMVIDEFVKEDQARFAEYVARTPLAGLVLDRTDNERAKE